MGKYKNLVDEMLRITEKEEVMQLFWISGQDLYAKWKDGNITFLGDKEVIEGIKFDYKVVKEFVAKKFGVEVEKVKVLKLSNSPNMHKKIAGLFKKQEEAKRKKHKEKVKKVEEIKEVNKTEKTVLEKDRIEKDLSDFNISDECLAEIKEIENDEIGVCLKDSKKEVFVVELGGHTYQLSDNIRLFIINRKEDFSAIYTDEKKDFIVKFSTPKEINLKDFLEKIIFEYKYEVIIEKEIKIIKNLNEFSDFLKEYNLIYGGGNSLVTVKNDYIGFEELEEKFGVKIEL